MIQCLILLASCSFWMQDPPAPEPWKPPQEVPQAQPQVDPNAVEWVDSTRAVVHDMILTQDRKSTRLNSSHH